jgi:hypothetical protein
MATDNQTIWMVYQSASGGCNFTSTSDFANNWTEPVSGGMPQQGVGGPCVPKMIVFKTHLYTYANKSIYRLEDVATPSSIIKNSSLAKNIDLYPNPVTDLLKIKFETTGNNCSWEIVNIFGQVLQNGQLTANNENVYTVSIGNLPAGYYLLKTNMDGNISINKFSKK